MQQRCTCKKEITGWYFNFDENDSKFDRSDVIGEHLIKVLRRLKAISTTNASITKTLHKIETTPELRKWFLLEVKKQAHKICYGWQCKMKITKHNKLCKLHDQKINSKNDRR